jgi:hypothetical protein
MSAQTPGNLSWGYCGVKPVTHCLSYGMAYFKMFLTLALHWGNKMGASFDSSITGYSFLSPLMHIWVKISMCQKKYVRYFTDKVKLS